MLLETLVLEGCAERCAMQIEAAILKLVLTVLLHVTIYCFSGWINFVQRKSSSWRNHIYRWLTNFNRPKHVVFYEHLKTNLHEELFKLSIFLGMNSTLSDIWCTLQDQEGLYHRVKPDWFVSSSQFTEELYAIVQSEIDKLYILMNQYAVPSEIRLNFDQLYRKRNNHLV